MVLLPTGVASNWLWVPFSLLSNRYRGLFPPGVEQPRHEAGRSARPSAQVTNAWTQNGIKLEHLYVPNCNTSSQSCCICLFYRTGINWVERERSCTGFRIIITQMATRALDTSLITSIYRESVTSLSDTRSRSWAQLSGSTLTRLELSLGDCFATSNTLKASILEEDQSFKYTRLF
jgi:hypothetical protein